MIMISNIALAGENKAKSCYLDFGRWFLTYERYMLLPSLNSLRKIETREKTNYSFRDVTKVYFFDWKKYGRWHFNIINMGSKGRNKVDFKWNRGIVLGKYVLNKNHESPHKIYFKNCPQNYNRYYWPKQDSNANKNLSIYLFKNDYIINKDKNKVNFFLINS